MAFMGVFAMAWAFLRHRSDGPRTFYLQLQSSKGQYLTYPLDQLMNPRGQKCDQ